ncbi:MAG: TrmH family RNA methyltransferase [Parcubacteria group bacterium]|nr:TrmH family RNA methyltransferase [Parcubacteria group bacterium]
MNETFVILHDIRSAENVGSIMRTSDAFGVSKVFLAGYTPLPTDRFGRAVPKISKTALGAEVSVDWESRDDIDTLIAELKEDGVKCVSVEQTENSVNYKDFNIDGAVAYVFGNEVDGLPKNVTDISDAVVEIEMKGVKESLNVAVSAGIILASS